MRDDVLLAPEVLLLAELMRRADLQGDVADLLHVSCVLHRLDGVRVEGRAAVSDAVQTRDSGARFTVVEHLRDHVRVQLRVPQLAGFLEFEVHGTVREGVLSEIRMCV